MVAGTPGADGETTSCVSQPNLGHGALQLGHSPGGQAELVLGGPLLRTLPFTAFPVLLNCRSPLLGGGAGHLPPSPSLPSLRATVLQGGPVTFQVGPVTQPSLLRPGRRLLPCQLGRGGGRWRGPLRGGGFRGEPTCPGLPSCVLARSSLQSPVPGRPLSLTPWLQGKLRHMNGPGCGPQSQS